MDELVKETQNSFCTVFYFKVGKKDTIAAEFEFEIHLVDS